MVAPSSCWEGLRSRGRAPEERKISLKLDDFFRPSHLPVVVVGVLAENHHSNVVERGHVEGVEDQLTRRENLRTLNLVVSGTSLAALLNATEMEPYLLLSLEEPLDLLHVGLLEFELELGTPVELLDKALER